MECASAFLILYLGIVDGFLLTNARKKRIDKVFGYFLYKPHRPVLVAARHAQRVYHQVHKPRADLQKQAHWRVHELGDVSKKEDQTSHGDEI
jgi:hypothetical protein